MKTKLKKLVKTWLIIALTMFLSSFMTEDPSRFFYGAFISFFVISAVFIMFGWDKYITYGDDD